MESGHCPPHLPHHRVISYELNTCVAQWFSFLPRAMSEVLGSQAVGHPLEALRVV